MTRSASVLLLLMGFLTGCTGTSVPGSVYSSDPAPQPVSQQAVSGQVRNRARTHTELGAAYLEAGRVAPALDEARTAINVDDGYPLAHNLLALVYMALKENGPAEESFQHALQLAPGDPDISNNYGWFLCETGRAAKAMPYLQTAFRNPLYASPALALNNAAVCSTRLGDDRSAEGYLQRAMRVDPNNLRGLYLLSDLTYRQGRYQEAKLYLAELHRKTDITAGSAWLGLRIARKLGDRGEEARYVSQLRQRFADSAENELLAQGRYE
ncbi:MAG TPA: type IV pilus biogenesis/stability protein PilW [Rhodocyclaceae bacterium]|nr:type IV pilus biogenesis/stability protein PilW [Rhodocyclaceae bacterium]